MSRQHERTRDGRRASSSSLPTYPTDRWRCGVCTAHTRGRNGAKPHLEQRPILYFQAPSVRDWVSTRICSIVMLLLLAIDIFLAICPVHVHGRLLRVSLFSPLSWELGCARFVAGGVTKIRTIACIRSAALPVLTDQPMLSI